jgi:hypothetical protein
LRQHALPLLESPTHPTFLEQAFEHHAQCLSEFCVDPAADPLRTDPRFAELLRRMNFPP